MRIKNTRSGACLALLAALALAACRKDEVTHVRVAREAPGTGATAEVGPTPAAAPASGDPANRAPGGGMATNAGGSAMSGDVPAPPSPTSDSALRWTLPKGWTETLSGGMRYATLKPPVGGKVDVSVIVLPGPAGGELANVNRWRSQIGLPPLDEAGLAAAKKPVATKAGPFSLYDFTSGGEARSRVVASLATVRGNTWFLKLSGDEAPVASARADFVRLLESLRLANP